MLLAPLVSYPLSAPYNSFLGLHSEKRSEGLKSSIKSESCNYCCCQTIPCLPYWTTECFLIPALNIYVIDNFSGVSFGLGTLGIFALVTPSYFICVQSYELQLKYHSFVCMNFLPQASSTARSRHLQGLLLLLQLLLTLNGLFVLCTKL